MHGFLTKFAAVVRGVLSCFDRLFFCGSLRRVSYGRGLQHYLWAHRILYKDFAAHRLEVTARLEEASPRGNAHRDLSIPASCCTLTVSRYFRRNAR